MTQQGDPREEVVETLKLKLPTALGTAAMPGTEGWSIDSVRTERFFGHAVVSLTLVCGERRHDFHLFPANSLEEPYYRDDRFDFVYIDNADENRGKRDRAVVDQFVRWLGVTFRPRTRQLAPIPLADAPAPPPPPSPDDLRLLDDLSTRLEAALRDGERPALAGWSIDSVALEPFRDHPTPTIRVSRSGSALRLQLLPAGSDKDAFFRTDRFDVLYDDDDKGSGFTQDHGPLEAVVAWLGATFPADPSLELRRKPAPASEEARRAEADAAAVEAALAPALAASQLPELAGYALAGVSVGTFREHTVPVVTLLQGERRLQLQLLPAGADADAFYRAERFDLFYNDDEWASAYGKHHQIFERLTRWLDETFPADETARARETARRRAAKAPADPALADLAASLDEKLRADLARGDLSLPEGWAFAGAEVELQRGEAAATLRFTRGAEAFVFRLLPTDPARAAYLRTARFDVLYDSAQGDWQLQDAPLAKAFMAWLAATFPGEVPDATSAPATESAPVAEKAPDADPASRP